MGRTRIEAAFTKARSENRAVLVTYLMAGDPDLEASYAALCALRDNGADIIELGAPFTDPMADGAAIQKAGLRALANGTKLADVIALAARFRKDDTTTPLILMVWLAVGFIALGLLLLLQVTFRTVRKGSFALPDADSAWRMIFIMVGFFAFVFFANSVGFVLCVAVLSFLLLLMVERKGWKLSLLISALITAGFWTIFEYSLQMRLPKGLLDFN